MLNQKNNHLYYDYNKHHNTNNQFNIIQEYISRVGKRLLIVNDTNKHGINLKIDFCFDNNNDDPLLKIDYEQKSAYTQNNTITVTQGLLNYLQDEAELATILAIALETINSNNIASLNLNLAIDADTRIINNLYKSGYDPKAFVELQQEYLKDKYSENNWLSFLFSPININEQRIYANKKTLLKIPNGMQRGKQRYLINMYLLKK